MTETWTINSLLAWTSEAFARRGINSARLDAELLLGHVLASDRLQLFLRADEPVGTEDRDTFRGLVRQRLEGLSVAYLLGTRAFYGHDFAVGRGVLVPRPETERLVDLVLEEAPRLADTVPQTLADVGTGSGCIGLSLAANLPEWHVTCLDISDEALAWAEQNRLALMPSASVQVQQHDALAGPPDAAPFGIVVSNPPYLTEAEMASATPEVQCEPGLALVAGPDGLDWYKAFVPQLSRWLAPGGYFAGEIGILQADAVVRLLSNAGLDAWWLPDYSDRPRYVLARNTI